MRQLHKTSHHMPSTGIETPSVGYCSGSMSESRTFRVGNKFHSLTKQESDRKRIRNLHKSSHHTLFQRGMKRCWLSITESWGEVHTYSRSVHPLNIIVVDHSLALGNIRSRQCHRIRNRHNSRSAGWSSSISSPNRTVCNHQYPTYHYVAVSV